jgi:hypothetical protein
MNKNFPLLEKTIKLTREINYQKKLEQNKILIEVFIQMFWKEELTKRRQFIEFLFEYCSCTEVIEYTVRSHLGLKHVYSLGRHIGIFDGIGIGIIKLEMNADEKPTNYVENYKDTMPMIPELARKTSGRIPSEELERFIIERI